MERSSQSEAITRFVAKKLNIVSSTDFVPQLLLGKDFISTYVNVADALSSAGARSTLRRCGVKDHQAPGTPEEGVQRQGNQGVHREQARQNTLEKN